MKGSEPLQEEYKGVDSMSIISDETNHQHILCPILEKGTYTHRCIVCDKTEVIGISAPKVFDINQFVDNDINYYLDNPY